jgi:putative MATE family efflux protein
MIKSSSYEMNLRRDSMKDLTKGSESKLIFYFALPMLAGNVLQQLYTTVDSYIVGNFVSKQAMGAVSLSFPIIFLLVSLVFGITIGATILMSQYYGAKDIKKVKATIDTTYVFLFISAIIITIVGMIFSKPILQLIKTPEDILPDAHIYLNITFAGIIFMFGYNSISAVLRGLGDSFTPMVFLIIAAVLNILLDLLFVLVFKWGVAGVAWATLISQAASFIFGIIYLNKNHEVLRFSIKKISFDKGIFKQSLKIGFPSGVQQMLFSLGMMAMQRIVNNFGSDVVAGFGVAGRLDSFATMPLMNFGAAISTFVGQNIGANKPERVRKGFHATLAMSSVICIVVGVVFIFFGENLVAVFNPDPKVIEVGSSYLRIVSPFYIVISAMFITNSVIRGAGDAFFPMISTLVALWAVRIPAAYILSGKIGYDGIWWGIPIGWTCGMIISLVYYRLGNWKAKGVAGSGVIDGSGDEQKDEEIVYEPS